MDDDLIVAIERLATDPGIDREAGGAEIRRAAGDDRRRLEEARKVFQRRVRRRSDDHVAQRAIRLLGESLDGVDRAVRYTHFNNDAYRK